MAHLQSLFNNNIFKSYDDNLVAVFTYCSNEIPPWRERRRSWTTWSFIMAAPIRTSEWPFRYLVAECITISAPSSNGLWVPIYKIVSILDDAMTHKPIYNLLWEETWKYGERNVLSTANRMSPLFLFLVLWTILATRSISTSFIVGLLGLSIHTSLLQRTHTRQI